MNVDAPGGAMAGGSGQVAVGERWLLARGGEVLATVAVWWATVLLRFLADSGARAPFVLETLAELVLLGAAYGVLLWSTGRLAPRATQRLVPPLALLASAGYLVVSVTRGPLVEKYAARFQSIHSQLADTTGRGRGVLRGCRAVSEEAFRSCLEGGFGSGRSSVVAVLVGSVVFAGLLRMLVGSPNPANVGRCWRKIDAAIERVSLFLVDWRVLVVSLGGAALALLVTARLSGATRGQAISISLRVTSFQPGDLVRLVCIGALAVALAQLGPRLRLNAERPFRPIPALRLTAWVLAVPVACAALFFANGDLGPLLVLVFTTSVMIWFGTDHVRYVVLSVLLFAVVSMVIWLTPLAPERLAQRFDTWLDPETPMFVVGSDEASDCPAERPETEPELDRSSPWVVCYFGRDQVVRAQMAVAEGGLIGVGVGNGRAAEWVPEAQTDAAPVVVAEESGLIGSALVLGAVALVALESIRTGLERPGAAGLFCGGFGVHLVIQSLVITGGLLGIAPLTGITLPLVSDGRSSSVTLLAGASLVVGWSHLGRQERAASAKRGEDVA